MRAESTRYRLCIGAMFAAGVLLLTSIEARLGAALPARFTQSDLLLWVTLISIAAVSPVPLLRGTATISLTPALDFAALFLYGPVVACWVAVVSRFVFNVAERWNPLPAAVFRLAQALLSVGVAGVVYASIGGQSASELMLHGTGEFLRIFAAAATYALVKEGLAVMEAMLRNSESTLKAVYQDIRESAVWLVLLLPLGVLVALTHVWIGSVGTALFLVPLLLARYFFKYWIETRKGMVFMVRTLMAAVDAVDPLTWGHSYRISRMCVRVGKHLGLSEKELEELEVGALLHDIGRTAIRHDVLMKPGKLTVHERGILRTHPVVGRDIVRGLPFFRGAADLVYSHHEQPDGQGYPEGLVAAEIPIGSRIIMAVAAFDALTSDRPYRRGLEPGAAFEEMLAHARTQFFPEVVEALIALHSNGALYEGFDDEYLARCEVGCGSSQAIREHLTRIDLDPGPPDTLDDAEPGAAGNGILPVLELLTEPPAETEISRTVSLGAGGSWRAEISGLSDLGCRRSNNEDSFGVFESGEGAGGVLLVLADGMGGAAAGEVASRLAVETVASVYRDGARGARTASLLEGAIREANGAVHARAGSRNELAGMGTTCTTAAIVGRELYLAHVGDSRAYLIDSGSIDQLTMDHTLATELVAMGSSRGPAPGSASRVLTRSLGSQPTVQIDVLPKPMLLSDGVCVVLCSDGLSEMLDPAEILDVLTQEEPQEACQTMVELARERGAPDNVTVLIAKIRSH